MARLISMVQTFFKVRSLYTANNFQADKDTCLRVQTDVQTDIDTDLSGNDFIQASYCADTDLYFFRVRHELVQNPSKI